MFTRSDHTGDLVIGDPIARRLPHLVAFRPFTWLCTSSKRHKTPSKIATQSKPSLLCSCLPLKDMSAPGNEVSGRFTVACKCQTAFSFQDVGLCHTYFACCTHRKVCDQEHINVSLPRFRYFQRQYHGVHSSGHLPDCLAAVMIPAGDGQQRQA